MRAVLVLLTACWSSSTTAPLPPPQPSEPVAASSHFRSRPPRSSCVTTIERVTELLRPEIAKTGLPEPTLEALGEAATESCLAEDWTQETLACFGEIQDVSELGTCQQLMTAEQIDDLQRRWTDVISKMGQLPPPAPPTP